MQFVQAAVLSLKDRGNCRPARKVMRLVPVALVLLAGTVHGAPVTASLSTEANCGGVLTTGSTYAACGVGASDADAAVLFLGDNGILVEATAIVSQTTNMETSTAEAGIGDDFLLTVTGGLEQGYYVTCVDAGAGEVYKFGGGDAGGTFGSAGAESEGNAGRVGCSPPVPFVAGVGQVILLAISAYAAATSAYAEGLYNFPTSEGGAEAFATVGFLDSSMDPVSNVTFSLIPLDIDIGVPEPASQWLVVSGLLIMAFLRGRPQMRQISYPKASPPYR